jgi:hypothetical protein
MKVINSGAGPPPTTSAGWATLSTASDYVTSSATAVELDPSLRVTVTVGSSGKVRVRHSLSALGSTNTQDAFTAVQVDGAGAWTQVAAFNLTIFNDFGAIVSAFEGEVELTGLSPGSHTFYFGWYTAAGGHALHCEPLTINVGMGLATWQAVTTLP